MTLHYMALHAAGGFEIDAESALGKAKTIVLIVGTIAFAIIGIKVALANYGNGQMKKAAEAFGVVAISAAIIAVGTSVSALALWGDAINGFAQKFLS